MIKLITLLENRNPFKDGDIVKVGAGHLSYSGNIGTVIGVVDVNVYVKFKKVNDKVWYHYQDLLKTNMK